MPRKRDCSDCLAYTNMCDGDSCGLGFKIEEAVEGGDGTWRVIVHPLEICSVPHKPRNKEEFVQMARDRGIDWDIEDVLAEDEEY